MKSKREKMSEKQLISKLSKVGNPFTLLKMFKNVKQFIASHQSDFPKNDVDDKIYLNIFNYVRFWTDLGRTVV